MTEPTIDVLLPFYGDPELLRIAVTSVLDQSSPHWRLVVVDDGYPDPAVAQWFSELGHPQVEYHRNPTNLGANANYARAVSLASSEFMVVMGADDVMLPSFIALLERALRDAPDVDVVQCGVDVIDEHGTVVLPMVDRIKNLLRPKVRGSRVLTQEHAMASLFSGNWTYFPSLCWRRETVTRIMFRPQFNVIQDLALLVDVLLEGGRMMLLSEVAFQYRRHSGSDSSVRALSGSRFDDERLYFDHMYDELRSRGLRRASLYARLHLTSRLHALVLLATMAQTGLHADHRRLVRHALT